MSKTQDYNSNINKELTSENIIPEAINEGVIVGLGPREVFWKSDLGNVELNSFTGKLSHKIPKNTLKKEELRSVVNGIKTGRLVVLNKHVKSEPVNTKWLTSEYAPRARRLLDIKDPGTFRQSITRTFSPGVVETAIELEREGNGRKERMEILNTRLGEILKI